MNKYFRWLIFVFATVLFVISVLIWSNMFLSYHHRVGSGNLLIEGWVNSYYIEKTLSYVKDQEIDRIYVTGKIYSTNSKEFVAEKISDRNSGVWLFANSSLSLKKEFLPKVHPGEKVDICIRVKGSKSLSVYAHFNLVVNGEKVKSFFTSDEIDTCFAEVTLKGKLESLSIYFDNDLSTQYEDRNLNLVSINISGTELNLNSTNSLLSKQKLRRLIGFKSEAEKVKSYMMDLGLENSMIQIIEFDPNETNITLSSAVAFKKAIKSDGLKDVNIISSGIHNRRSWLTYKRILSETAEVGCIYFKPESNNEKLWYKTFYGYVNLIDEMISYLANWLYLTF